jgi:hypothetical protein
MTRWGRSLLLSIVLFGAFSLTGCSGGGGGSGDPAAPPPAPAGTIVSKTATLGAAEEVPPVATSAGGSGHLDVDNGNGNVSGSLTIGTAPTSTIIVAHVLEGGRGVNGGIVIVLENAGGGVFSVPSGKALSAAQISTFSAGGFYFNVRTAEHPNGEIRGQIDGQ